MVTVSGTLAGEKEPRTVRGTVSQWQTAGNGSPWANPQDHDRQLAYRGAREWARRHAPGVVLGVITDDEAKDFAGMKNVTPEKAVREKPIDPFETPALAEAKRDKATAGTLAMLSDVEIRHSKEDAKKPWTAYIAELFIDGRQVNAGTFSKTIGELAISLKGSSVLVEVEQTEKGHTLKGIAPAVASEGGLL